MKTPKHDRSEPKGTDVSKRATTQSPRSHSQFAPVELRRAIRLPEVLHMTGLSRSAWYARLNPKHSTYDDAAPRPFKLGNTDRSPSAWWAWEVLAYLQAKSNAGQAH